MTDIITTKTVFDAVEEYMALSGNQNPAHKATYLLRGKWIWKDIRNNVLRSTYHKWVVVDKTKSPWRATVPGCMSMFMGVSAKTATDGCISLTPDPEMCTVDYETLVANTCGCPAGINECITTSETTTETITIEGTPYTKTVVTTIQSNGDVFKEITEPIAELDSEGNFVQVNMTPRQELICNLEVKSCGCVAVTPENLDIITTCCCPITVNGFSVYCNTYEKEKPLTIKNGTGYFKYDGDRIVFLKGSIPDQVLMNGISTGEGEDEEIIPDYAMQTFFDGMNYMNTRYNNSMNRFQQEEIKRTYLHSKGDLEMMLPRNKVNIFDFVNSTNKIARW